MIFRRLTLLLPLLAACENDFDPASKVEKLRLLALQAEPPEIAPAAYGNGAIPDRAQLRALVGHPAFVSDSTRRATAIHIACTSSVENANDSPCTNLSSLATPEQLLSQADPTALCGAATPGTGQVDGVTLSGIESCGVTGCEPVSIPLDPADPSTTPPLSAPAYVLPGSLGLDGLPPTSPERILGLEVIDLVLLLDASPTELASSSVADPCAALDAFIEHFVELWPIRPHVSGVMRLHVRGPDATGDPNQNPVVEGITLGGQSLPSSTPVTAGAQVSLLPALPANAVQLHQRYFLWDATGAVISEETEEWSFAWFATAGDLHQLHTSEDEAESWYVAPPPSSGGKVLVFMVAYDLRGGVSWAFEEVTVDPQ